MYAIHPIRGLGCLAAVLVAGCNVELPDVLSSDDTVTPGDEDTTSTTTGSAGEGELKVSFDVSADADPLPDDGIASVATECGDAMGIHLAIADDAGNVQTCDEVWAPVSVSGDYAGGASGEHYVADCLFVVAAGKWTVEDLYAIDADGEALSCCESSYPESVEISEEETSELAGLIQCDTEANGGLDIYATVNTPPQIEEVTISPSKFGGTCSPITLTASATDPEGDLVNFSWEVSSAPAGADYDLSAKGSSAVFASSMLGDFEMLVTATDELKASHSLSFPLHIVDDAAGTDCDVEEICE